MREINFDGLVGPSHNYAGLSVGNLASARNLGATAAPRAAALQGLAKMRRMLALGPQGLLLPHDRPAAGWLRELGFAGDDDAVLAAAWSADPALLGAVSSASAMWVANAATVSPAPDTRDGRCHLSVANVATMLHRSIEPAQTTRQLRLAFGDARHFTVHDALPTALGDEGAANHMRLCAQHGVRGIELFVYGEQRADGFPARQNKLASAAIARRHGLDPDSVLLVQQSDAAIAAGAFHNDVVAVANEQVLFAHEQAFQQPDQVYAFIRAHLAEATLLIVPASAVSLEEAIRSYLFNSQLVGLPGGGMMLVLPSECREVPSVSAWIDGLLAGNGPVRQCEFVNLRESMRNGGGPACLRLRVVVDAAAEAAIDPRFLLDEARCDRIARVVEAHWPEHIAPSDLGRPDLWSACRAARAALLDTLDFAPGTL